MPGSATSPARAASSAGRSPRTTARKAWPRCYAELGLGPDDGLFFAAGKEKEAAKLAGAARTRVGEQLDLIEQDGFKLLLDRRFPDVRVRRGRQEGRFQPQPVLDAAGRAGGAGNAGPADDPRLAVRHRLQRLRAGLGRDPEPPPEIMYKAFEIAGYARPMSSQLLRHDRGVQVRRAAARRVRRRASTASSCCWRTSRTSARSRSSR